MKFDVELVGKIGSMALIYRDAGIIDYTRVARFSKELKPGHIWISSGATEIGRLDYIARHKIELSGDADECKTDYSAQGQTILMSAYRQFIDPNYSVRQVLVEHTHFNDEDKRQHLKNLLLRCTKQNAIPIINYNDAVSFEENRKWEIQSLVKSKSKVIEAVDNDETAAQIACIVNAKRLLILTSVDGIYHDKSDCGSLIKEIGGRNILEVLENIEEAKSYCVGASRAGANGAKAKLEYIKDAVKIGTEVIIANAKYTIKDILENTVPATRIGVR